MNDIELIVELKALELKENDLLVVRAKGKIPHEVAVSIGEAVIKVLPASIKEKVGVLVMDSDTESVEVRAAE